MPRIWKIMFLHQLFSSPLALITFLIFLQLPLFFHYADYLPNISLFICGDILDGAVCNSTSINMIICGAWSLWPGMECYARRHGRRSWELWATVRHVSNMLDGLTSLKTKTKSATTGGRDLESYDTVTCTGSTSVVIKYYQGKVVAGAARWF